MAVNLDGCKITTLVNNIRTARIYINQLKIEKLNEPLDEKNLYVYNKEINAALQNNKTQKESEDLIKNINDICNNNLLPIDLFNWIKNEDRACYYAWGKTRTLNVESYTNNIKNNLLSQLGRTLKENKKTSTAYDELNLSKYPSSTKERFELIIYLFDFIDLSLPQKEAILNDIKNEWSIIFNKKNPFRWLDMKNEELCEWAWCYIKKHSNFCDYLSPTNNIERYHSFYAAFDLWDASEDTKKLFSININKAYSQQKFRAGIKNKKALNTFIDEKSKKRLDDLSKRKGMKINQLIEYLIDEEFKKPESNSR